MNGLTPLAYRDGATALTGWVARPAGKARGAVVVFPTIANVTANIERKAHSLAQAGYLALIADFYGEAVVDFAAGGALAKVLRADPLAYRRRLGAALGALQAMPEAAGLRCAAIGFCMGGQAALELARSGADLVAAVSFHGLLDTQIAAAPDAIKARLLICHGDADPMVPRPQVLAFWEEMTTAGADWHFHTYAKVAHGFTDPASDAREIDGIHYNASADRQSWAAMAGLFDEVFG